ncbi:MAG: lysophospholipid acyltransferase family protein, partial [Candidatus Rokuibacteriota bacterium]
MLARSPHATSFDGKRPVTGASEVESPPARWHAHPYNRSRYYRLAAAAAPRVPRAFRTWLATRMASSLGARFPAERAAVRRNLARVHPEREAAWLDAAVDRVYERFAVCFADLLSLNRGPRAGLWSHVAGIDEQAPTRAALARGRGCVSITAHLGNWQLAGRLLAVLGRPVHVVMAPEVDPAVGALLDREAPPGVRFVRLTSPVVGVELVAALRRGEVVAFQLDRAIGGRGAVEMPFFGHPATFPLGPFVIAGAAGAPVVPAFCVLQPDTSYRLHVEPALPVSRGAEPEALRAAVGILERYVRAHWDQW